MRGYGDWFTFGATLKREDKSREELQFFFLFHVAFIFQSWRLQGGWIGGWNDLQEIPNTNNYVAF